MKNSKKSFYQVSFCQISFCLCYLLNAKKDRNDVCQLVIKWKAPNIFDENKKFYRALMTV